MDERAGGRLTALAEPVAPEAVNARFVLGERMALELSRWYAVQGLIAGLNS